VELKFPNPKCSSSPSGAHFYIEQDISHSIWQCKYCQATVWFPQTVAESTSLTNAKERLGIQKAYQAMLSRRPEVADAIEALLQGGKMSGKRRKRKERFCKRRNF